MSKSTRAFGAIPPASQAALDRLGADLAEAQLRRKELLRSWASRMRVSVATLQRLEAGDPSVSIGIAIFPVGQVRIIQAGSKARALAGALNVSAANGGIALGAAIGGGFHLGPDISFFDKV